MSIAAEERLREPANNIFSPDTETAGLRKSEALHFISQYIPIDDPYLTLIVRTNQQWVIDLQTYPGYTSCQYANIVNLQRVNDLKEINQFFRLINDKLPTGGRYGGCVQTKHFRKQYFLERYPFILGYLLYCFDFIFHRIFPKISFLRRFYFWFMADKSQVLTGTETIGRLYYCGFKVVDLYQSRDILYFVVEKVKTPIHKNIIPACGLICKLRRMGKDGKLIYVYKLRTMHAYSEFLQEYVYEKNKLKEGGKIKDDFRVSTIGGFLRKYWIDELPMIINVLKGDMKLVGVRPLSQHYFSLYTQELQQLRTSCKPGLIPPYYADLPKTLEEIMASEQRYLLAYMKHPFLTDVRYLYLILYNILVRKVRSQ